MKPIAYFFYSIIFLNGYIHAYDFKKITVIGHQQTYPTIRSFLRGLQLLRIPHNFNDWNNLGDCLCVISDVPRLQRAINLKRYGTIKRLLAGPNHVVRATDDGGIIGSPEIDKYLVNSEWTHVAYQEDLPSLGDRLGIWFAGIDADDWCPTKTKKDNNVLVYWKTEPESFCIQVENALRKFGFNPIRLRYGFYKKNQYKQLLNKSLFAIFLSRVESQGIALLEAWSMNVPTLVWNPQVFTLKGKVYSQVSACPYLSDATGKDWRTIQELESLLTNIQKIIPTFTPRKWVLFFVY